MKRQAHSSHTLNKYSGGPNIKQLHQDGIGAGLNGGVFPNLQVQQKIDKIPTTFVFDKRIPPQDYKNFISIDDIYNENFEYARKLFEDPSRAFAVADYSSDHKIPRRLAQVNYKIYTAQEKKREKKVNFAKQQGQMNSTVGGGSKFYKNEVSNILYPPPPNPPSLQKQATQIKQQQQLFHTNSLLSPQQSPLKQQNEDQLNLFKDLSPLRQQSQVPDYVHENINWNQQRNDTMIDQSQLQKSLITSQTQIHHLPSQQGIVQAKDNLVLQPTPSTDQKRGLSQQASLFQKKNSFVVPASANASVLAATKSTVALPAQNTQINNFTATQSMKALPTEKKEKDRVHELIDQTREKVKRLQSYAEKLKRRVMQSKQKRLINIDSDCIKMIMDKAIREVRRLLSNNNRNKELYLLSNQFILNRKSQLVKNFIFNEDDFNKMLIQEEEEDKKNQANKKEKLKLNILSNVKQRGFIERSDAFTLAEDSKKNPTSYQSQIIEQYIPNKGYLKQKSAYQLQDDEDESDKSKEELKEEGSGLFQKSDQKFKSSKHNFHKKMVLKKKNFDEKVIVQEAKEEYNKVINKLTKQEKHWNYLSIMPEKTNQVRAESLQYARSGKILRIIGDKYGDIDLLVPPQTQKVQIKNQQDLLNHLQALLTKPDVSGDFKLHKQVQIHKNRIKNMRQKDVGITNISNISIEA